MPLWALPRDARQLGQEISLALAAQTEIRLRGLSIEDDIGNLGFAGLLVNL
jgi:hypothetical protein